MQDLIRINDPDLEEYIRNPGKFTQVDTVNLSKELSELPTWYARFSQIYAMSKQITQTCKLVMEVKYAECYRKYKDEGMTDKTADNASKSDASYVKARQAYIDAEHQENIIRGAVESLDHKRYVMISLGAIYKQEMQTGIKIMEDQMKTLMRGDNNG